MAQKQIVLSTSTAGSLQGSLADPGDFDPNNNTVEIVSCGANGPGYNNAMGISGGGGAGGSYLKATNVPLVFPCPYVVFGPGSVGVNYYTVIGTPTYMSVPPQTPGIVWVRNSYAGSSSGGGTAYSDAYPGVATLGGSGGNGTGAGPPMIGGGGGGAAGPNGPGSRGSDWNAGGGGGAADGGTVPGGGNGAPGNSGTEWGTYGCGSGGGSTLQGGAGPSGSGAAYGGGGAGGSSATNRGGGTNGGSLIVITYTPLAPPAFVGTAQIIS